MAPPPSVGFEPALLNRISLYEMDDFIVQVISHIDPISPERIISRGLVIVVVDKKKVSGDWFWELVVVVVVVLIIWLMMCGV
jgi:hypothetical protein